jgi:hypothetical protein
MQLGAVAFLAELAQIFYFIVFPLLLLAGVGFVVQRALGLDMPTLTRLNFYFVIPGLVYASVVQSELTAEDVLTVVGFTLLVMATLAAVSYAAASARGVPREQRAALVMSTMFYNSGNYGLPLQELAFRSRPAVGLAPASTIAVSLQVFVMLVQNVTSFTLGVLLASSGHRTVELKRALLLILRFPPIYALLAGGITVLVRSHFADASAVALRVFAPFWDALGFVKAAFVAIALCTLGAQLALVKPKSTKYPVVLAVVTRLLVGPLVGLGLVYALGLSGLLAQVLMISTSTPAAVNSLLLCVEFDNHAEFVAKNVFYSMVLSPITVTLTVFLTQSGLLEVFSP